MARLLKRSNCGFATGQWKVQGSRERECLLAGLERSSLIEIEGRSNELISERRRERPSLLHVQRERFEQCRENAWVAGECDLLKKRPGEPRRQIDSSLGDRLEDSHVARRVSEHVLKNRDPLRVGGTILGESNAGYETPPVIRIVGATRDRSDRTRQHIRETGVRTAKCRIHACVARADLSQGREGTEKG